MLKEVLYFLQPHSVLQFCPFANKDHLFTTAVVQGCFTSLFTFLLSHYPQNRIHTCGSKPFSCRRVAEGWAARVLAIGAVLDSSCCVAADDDGPCTLSTVSTYKRIIIKPLS